MRGMSDFSPGKVLGSVSDLSTINYADDAQRKTLLERFERLPALTISELHWSNIALLGGGAFDPLKGFVGREDYRSVTRNGTLAYGRGCSIPVPLLVENEFAVEFGAQAEIALRDMNGKNVAVLTPVEFFPIDTYSLRLFFESRAGSRYSHLRDLPLDGNVEVAGRIDIIRFETSAPLEFGRARRDTLSHNSGRETVGGLG